MMAVLGGGVALALVILAVGVTFGGSDDGGGDEGASGDATPVALTEFAIDGSLAVAPGGTLDVTNEGSQIHNLVIEGGDSTADLGSGESESMVVDLSEGEYEVYCSISGHREAGMVATLAVAEGATAESAEPTVDHSSHSADDLTPEEWAALDQAMTDSFGPFVETIETGVPNTEGIGGEDLAPTIGEDGAKEWTLTAAITPWEIEPGTIVDAWTYNGTVPGPTLRAEVGDTVRVTIVNDLPLGTDVHMHGSKHPNDMDGVAPLTQELIMPGEEFVYEFEVTEAAVAMYHPHHHGQMTVPNGMWGAMIFSPPGGDGSADYTIPRGTTVSGVEIPADLEVAAEENMVLNDGGVIGLSLNGKSFPATEAYAFETGDWVLINYYNEGLQAHPMHLHQFPQLVVARDGIPLDQPYFADTISVLPGERYTVLFQAKTPGVWVWHCHILNHAEREEGMFGMVTAVKVDDPAAA